MFVDPNNIKKLLYKKNGQVWVYLKTGYPKIIKTTEGSGLLHNRMTNCNLINKNFNIEYE